MSVMVHIPPSMVPLLDELDDELELAPDDELELELEEELLAVAAMPPLPPAPGWVAPVPVVPLALLLAVDPPQLVATARTPTTPSTSQRTRPIPHDLRATPRRVAHRTGDRAT